MPGSRITHFYNEHTVEQAACHIASGGLVVFPTETVYGLGADARNDEACKAIFVAKGRPADNPLIVHIHSLDQLDECAVHVPDIALRLFSAFSPGPLTIVLPKAKGISPTVSAGLNTVGIRIPAHPLAQRFLAAAACPLAAPSANISGKNSPSTYEMAVASMNGRVDGIIDGGDCTVGLESTVIGLFENRFRILRPGAITAEMIIDLFQNPNVFASVAGGFELEAHKPASPGMKYTHYKPVADVYLIPPGVEMIAVHDRLHAKRIGCIGIAGELGPDDGKSIRYEFSNLAEYARNLYKTFFELDQAGCDCIIAQLPESSGLGLALLDRLEKAAAGKRI